MELHDGMFTVEDVDKISKLNPGDTTTVHDVLITKIPIDATCVGCCLNRHSIDLDCHDLMCGDAINMGLVYACGDCLFKEVTDVIGSD